MKSATRRGYKGLAVRLRSLKAVGDKGDVKDGYKNLRNSARTSRVPRVSETETKT